MAFAAAAAADRRRDSPLRSVREGEGEPDGDGEADLLAATTGAGLAAGIGDLQESNKYDLQSLLKTTKT